MLTTAESEQIIEEMGRLGRHLERLVSRLGFSEASRKMVEWEYDAIVERLTPEQEADREDQKELLSRIITGYSVSFLARCFNLLRAGLELPRDMLELLTENQDDEECVALLGMYHLDQAQRMCNRIAMADRASRPAPRY